MTHKLPRDPHDDAGANAPKPAPEPPSLAFDNRHNLLRQALRASLIAYHTFLDAHQERHPHAAQAVAMAREVLRYLDTYLHGPLDPTIQLAEWWSLHQGSAHFIDYMNTKTQALDLLDELFATLRRLGLTVLHERP